MKKLFVILAIAMSVVALLSGIELSGGFAYADEQGVPSIHLSIDGTSVSYDVGEEENFAIHSVLWEKLTKFTLSVNNLTGDELEEFAWSLDYSKKQSSLGSYLSFQINYKLTSEVSNGLTFDYDINNYGASSGTSSFPLGFGIYRFKLTYKKIDETVSKTLHSDIVHVKPSVITESPQINYMVISNSSTQLKSFSFSVANVQSYKHCDESVIKWHVSATVNGEPWEIEKQYYGKKFLFMPTTENEFTVWCAVTTEDETFTSESLTVSTIKNEIDLTTFWVIVASSIGGIFIILIIFALISSKREKIY